MDCAVSGVCPRLPARHEGQVVRSGAAGECSSSLLQQLPILTPVSCVGVSKELGFSRPVNQCGYIRAMICGENTHKSQQTIFYFYTSTLKRAAKMKKVDDDLC